jgi:hypothetical protein
MPMRGLALKTSYTKTEPKKWFQEEIKQLQDLKRNGSSVAEIAKILGRSEISIQVKLKRLSKNKDTYNKNNRLQKYSTNQEFFELLQPTSVLDLYAGNSWYKDKASTLITNDLDKSFQADYNQDALRLLCLLYLENKKFDLVDLDPFGSAYECFDLAMKLAKKGIVISFGEWGHKRWKRLDYVRSRYQINTLEDFIEDKFIQEAHRAARHNKKTLTLFRSIQYANFFRAYFVIEPLKITEQWEK